MKLNREDALHLAKVLGVITINEGGSTRQLEHLSAVEDLRARLDEFILDGDDEEDDNFPTPCIDGTINRDVLFDLPRVGVIVGSAGFGRLNDSLELELDYSDEHEDIARLHVYSPTDRDDDHTIVDGIAYVRRTGDEVTFYQGGVAEDAFVHHTVTLAANNEWRTELTDGQLLLVTP